MSTYLNRLQPTDATDSAVALVTRARAYAYAGQLDSALATADRLATSSSVDRRAPWVHRLRGHALATAKQCERALPELAQTDTTAFEVLTVRAECEMQLGHRMEALALRDRALASQEFSLLYPPMIRARVRLAQMK